MMGINAATRTEVVLRRVGVELVKRQRVLTTQKVDTVQIGGYGHRTPHAAKRTGTAPGCLQAIGQPHCEPDSSTVTGGIDLVDLGVHGCFAMGVAWDQFIEQRYCQGVCNSHCSTGTSFFTSTPLPTC